MVKEYTPIFNNWQIRNATYIDGHEDSNHLDVVEWAEDRSHCWSVANLIWDEEDEYFELSSVGVRMLEVDDPGLLCKWLLNFVKYETENRRMLNDIDF